MHYWTLFGMGNSLGHDRTTSSYGPCISGPRLSCFKWWPMVSSWRKLSQLSCNIWRSPQWCCTGGDICSSFQLSVSKTCGYSSKKLMAGHKAKSQLSYSQLAVLLLPPWHEKVRSHGTSISQKTNEHPHDFFYNFQICSLLHSSPVSYDKPLHKCSLPNSCFLKKTFR